MFDTSFGLKIWIYPGLFCGVIMYLIMTIISPVMDGEIITRKNLYSLPVWLIVGLVMQYFQFKRINTKKKKRNWRKNRLRRLLY